MKSKLILMRGAPGAGKSTWIEKHGLSLFKLCPDELRILFSSIEEQSDGTTAISQKHDKIVWDTFYKILRYRMSLGLVTVIDGICSRTKDINEYKKLADEYNYEVLIIDFADVPLETCLEQNKKRPQYKWVPDEVIKNIYSRYATQQIPEDVKIINYNEDITIF